MRLSRRRASGRFAAEAVVLALGGAFTAFAWLVPGFDVAYGGEGMHIAVAAIQATVCLVVGGVAWAHFARSRQLADLAVVVAFGLVMTVESAFFLALPTLLNYEQLRPFSVWTSTVTAVLAPLLLLGGAVAGRRVARRGQAALLVGANVLLLALASGLILAYERRLPLAIEPGLSPVAAHRHAFVGNAAVLACHAVAALLFLAAAAAWLARRAEDQGPLLGWLGPAYVAAGLTSLNYALFPSLYSYWVYSGDVLRLAFCVVLAWGIVLELRASVRRAIEVAVLEERRRLARDLHDGVAQELAFIAAEIADVPAALHPSLPWIRSAVDRGLYESRRAIAALTMPLGGPLAEAIGAVVEDVAARSGTTVRMDVDETVEVSDAEREALLRVIREATTNAIRHGAATMIRVSLEGTGGRLARLEVADNGTGLDSGVSAGGFGLTSMRERVQATGGELLVTTTAGGGTTVEARWPACSARCDPPGDLSERGPVRGFLHAAGEQPQ